MTPFDKYLEESKQVKEKYDIAIAANPERKPELLVEMHRVLAEMLDKCEKEEQDIFKKNDLAKETK